MMFRTAFLVFCLVFAFPAFGAENSGRVLFTYGGWEGHEPEAYRDLLVPWLQDEGFEVIVSDSLDPYADAELIAKQALEVAPENPVAQTMKWKARFARRDDSNARLKDEKAPTPN